MIFILYFKINTQVKQELEHAQTLKYALADISDAIYTCKQSAVTFKVFILWLRNQHYYTRM